MNNSHGATIFIIIFHWHGLLLTTNVAFLFGTTEYTPYPFFAVAAALFGYFYREMAAVLFYHMFRRWYWWQETTGDSLSPMMSRTDVFYMYHL